MRLSKRNFACTVIVVLSSLSVVSATTAVSQQALEDAPIPPRPQGPGEHVEFKRQSGIGGDFAYGQSGVVELGGSLGLTQADKYTGVNFSPAVGYFFMNNLQISLMGDVGYSKVEDADSQTVGSIILEPSFHYPTTNTTFVFAGLGLGALFETNEETGLALAPRLGFKTLVGRSGMLTISMQPIIAVNEDEDASQRVDGSVLQVSRTNNLRIGYSVLL